MHSSRSAASSESIVRWRAYAASQRVYSAGACSALVAATMLSRCRLQAKSYDFGWGDGSE
jgi:hypothetical protein